MLIFRFEKLTKNEFEWILSVFQLAFPETKEQLAPVSNSMRNAAQTGSIGESIGLSEEAEQQWLQMGAFNTSVPATYRPLRRLGMGVPGRYS
jgi:hypothetical protein